MRISVALMVSAGGDQRPGHVAERSGPAGTIDSCGVDELLGNGLQGSQVDHDDEPGRLLPGHEDHRTLCGQYGVSSGEGKAGEERGIGEQTDVVVQTDKLGWGEEQIAVRE